MHLVILILVVVLCFISWYLVQKYLRTKPLGEAKGKMKELEDQLELQEFNKELDKMSKEIEENENE